MIGQPLKKIDSGAITTGIPIYTDDFANKEDTLTVKILRSPYAFAKIVEIDTSAAQKIPGVTAIYTHKDTPKHRYTAGGKSFPQSAPNDRRILDEYVRYVGDGVAIIAAETEKAAEKAMKLIKVKYEVFEPLLDYKKAVDNPIIVHPEDDITVGQDEGLQAKRNIVSEHCIENGDFDKAWEEADIRLERELETQPQAHCMMETHRAYSYYDEKGRIVLINSTQTPFHSRRQTAAALGIPTRMVKSKKPRIGGGFGGKTTCLTEPYVAFVTSKTGRPAKLIYTRKETFSCSNSRHGIYFKIRMAAKKDGTLTGIEVEAINNTGAYGEEGPAVTIVVAHNILPLYHRAWNIRYHGITVYSNMMPGGALRGYGATQSAFAVEACINEMAEKAGMSPIDFQLKNLIRYGDEGKGILGATVKSCNIQNCIERGRRLAGWDEKYPCRKIDDHTIRSVGMSVAMHGSSIRNVDKGAVTIRLEDGNYILLTGSADLGTGSDTMLAQIAAETLDADMEQINLRAGDTDSCPYDTGAYASCTTYVTGNAVLAAASELKNRIIRNAAEIIVKPVQELELEEECVYWKKDHTVSVTLKEIEKYAIREKADCLEVTETYGSTLSPNPFVAGFAEIDIDTMTYKVKVNKFVGVFDCGTLINKNLARVQAEGGLMQGIGFALYEEVCYDTKGRMLTDSFMQYKIPTREDVPEVIVDFEPSYEPSGPYGAKSMGELVVHTPAPAIENAIYNALGVHISELPMTPEKIFQAVKEKHREDL